VLRASTQQIYCEAALQCVSCNNAVLNCKCLATLAIIALIAERFPLVPLPIPDDIRVVGYRARIPGDIYGDFEVFQIACVTVAATGLTALR